MKNDKAGEALSEPTRKKRKQPQARQHKTAPAEGKLPEASSSTVENSRLANEVEIISADGSSDCMIEEPLAPVAPNPAPVCIIEIDSSDEEPSKPHCAQTGVSSRDPDSLEPFRAITGTPAAKPKQKQAKKKQKKQKQSKGPKSKSVDPPPTAALQAPAGQMQLEPLHLLIETSAQVDEPPTDPAPPPKEKTATKGRLSKRLNNLNQHTTVRETCRKLNIDEDRLLQSMKDCMPDEIANQGPLTKNASMLIKLEQLLASSKKHGPTSIVDYLLNSRDRQICLTLYNSQTSDPLISVDRRDQRSFC